MINFLLGVMHVLIQVITLFYARLLTCANGDSAFGFTHDTIKVSVQVAAGQHVSTHSSQVEASWVYSWPGGLLFQCVDRDECTLAHPGTVMSQ